MDDEMETSARWLRWARELQAIAHTGLHFTVDPFDNRRFSRP